MRQRKAQIGAPDFDRDEARARHGRTKAPAHGFDFGQFGHRAFTLAPGRDSAIARAALWSAVNWRPFARRPVAVARDVTPRET
jgi:hypothetical protein